MEPQLLNEILKYVAGGGGGAGGLFVLFLLYKYFEKRRNGDSPTASELKTMVAEVKWLKDVHNQKSQDGVYSWYFPEALRETIKEMVKASQENTMAVATQHTTVNTLVSSIDRLISKMNGIITKG